MQVNMSEPLKKLKSDIEAFEDFINADVILYYGEIHENKIIEGDTEHLICDGDLDFLIKARKVREDRPNLFIFLQSNGGRASSALAMVDFFRAHYSHVESMVPTAAKSSGAFIVLCADQPYMAPGSAISDFAPTFNMHEKSDNGESDFVSEFIKDYTNLHSEFSLKLRNGSMKDMASFQKVFNELFTVLPNAKRIHGEGIGLREAQKLIPQIKSFHDNDYFPTIAAIHNSARQLYRDHHCKKMILYKGSHLSRNRSE